MRCLLFFPRNKKLIFQIQLGFTLLEILVVIALLAIIAGVIITAYGGVKDQGRADTAKFEMAEIRKALLQFRRDSGSRDFPNQRIYDCDSLSLNEAKANDPDDSPNILTWPEGAPSADADALAWSDWCKHPANFWMLFINPLDDLNTSVEEGIWNPDTHRGWNGPYLQRNNGYLDIGNDLSTAGTGNPNAGVVINNVWGIASPYVDIPQGDFFVWSNISDSTANGYKEYEQYGRPYFIFDLDDEEQARIVSVSVDGLYNSSVKNNPNCEQEVDSEGTPIDNILCLLR